MFNFKLQQKAFEELSAEQFRVVYFLNNTLSMVNKSNKTPDNNKIEMFNGYMMDKLGLKERMVQYHIKTLEQKGYIKVKRPIGRNASKQPNIITINNDINCDKNVTLNKEENNAINDAINDAINCTLNKNTKENKNNNITTGILEHKDLEPEVTKENKKYKIKNIKEKNNKKEKLPDQSSMDVKVSEPENKNLSLKKMKENEVSDTGTNVMNAISEQSERQAKENESSGCDKINEMTTSMATPKLQDTQVTNNESLSQPQVKNILPPATATFEEDTDPRITKTIHNIDFSMNAMYNGRYDYGQFSSQYEYFTLQCHNLNVLMGDDKYQLYKKQYITPWWNNTKQYFPDGYEKLMKKPTQWEIDKFKKFYDWMEHAQEEREVASAYNNICVLLEHLNSKYGEKTLDALTNQIIHEISAIKHRNNHVSNYIEKIQAS